MTTIDHSLELAKAGANVKTRWQAMLFLPIWGVIGLVIYFTYSRSRSHLGRGIVEVHEPEYADLEPDIPGVTDRGRP